MKTSTHHTVEGFDYIYDPTTGEVHDKINGHTVLELDSNLSFSEVEFELEFWRS